MEGNGDPVVRPDHEPPMLDQLSEQIILSAVERPARHGGGGALLVVRILNAELMGPGFKPGLYFKVFANITVLGESKQWRAEGYDLNEAIRETIGLIPQGLLYPLHESSSASPRRRVVKRKKQSEPSAPKRTASAPEPSPTKKRRVVRRG
jgi:hypothetical protein